MRTKNAPDNISTEPRPLPAHLGAVLAAAASPVFVRTKLDTQALYDLELLLLRASNALTACLAVRSTDAAMGVATDTPAFGAVSSWSVLLPCVMAVLPVRHYHGLNDHGTEQALQWVSALLNACMGVVAAGCLAWLLGTAPLSALHGAALLATLFILSGVGRMLVHKAMGCFDDTFRVVIIGAGEQGVLTAKHLAESASPICVVGFLDDRHTRLRTPDLPAPWLGATERLEQLRSQIDGVVIALPNVAGARIQALATTLRSGCLHVYLAPDLPVLQDSLATRPHAVRHNLMLLGMNALPLGSRLVKRSFDVVFSLVALSAFLPCGIVIAALIKLGTPGPVFFVQPRYGMGYQLFNALKFRSMRHDPMHASKGIELTLRDDARVTRVGAILRHTSLDEFPQFVNVLLGQMSVVGPRPHPPGVKAGDRVYESVIHEFVERYKVPAGITGWAQINGYRGNTFTEEHLTKRFACDVQYIRNWSLELDLWIILKTALGGFKDSNAF